MPCEEKEDEEEEEEDVGERYGVCVGAGLGVCVGVFSLWGECCWCLFFLYIKTIH